MTAAAPLAAVLEAGGPELARRLQRTEVRLAEVAESHGAKLAGGASDTLAAGGKRLRPMLVFLCGAPDADGALPAAVAVELLHMATLVHDDVLDQASLRRGRPTVFATGGRHAATTTGDFLFSRAFAELAPTRSAAAVRSLSAASSALARGELMQRADAWSASVTRERYLERCELKTASLFSEACRLGAILGDASEATRASLAGFGRRIGLAFQILDDVLDVSGPAERTGKHRGADLLDGTVTLPLIVARGRDAGLERMDLRAAVTEPAEADELCTRIAATGALEEARAEALRHVAEAKARLADLDLPADRRKALDLVAGGVVDRYA
ncbi:MAG: polyprenyl synthetase family protein [Actinomycetota bacterium]|nr:polyprenyl synthetase family protein [Actinomycetota bacterium]